MSAALRLAAALAGQLGWIGLDRVAGRRLARADGVPRDVTAIDAAWLDEALRAGGAVRGVAAVGGHSGTTTRARLRLTVDPARRNDGTPDTVFVKLAPTHWMSRLFTGVLGLGASEVEFYRRLAAAVPVRVPRTYCARRAARGGSFVLLLEDLEASGCRFPASGAAFDEPEARAVVAALARLHAAFWESPRLARDLAWLRSPENNPHRSIEWWICARSHGPALSRHGDRVPPSVRANAHRIHRERPRLEAHWARAPRTVLHGDPHGGNLFFDGAAVGLLDWQVVQAGPGLRDVAYFLVNSLDTEVRRAHERDLLDHYREALAESGVRSPGRDAVWEEYRLFALYTWIAVSVTAAAATLQTDAVVRRAIERTGRALEDLDSFAALSALVGRSGASS